MRRKHATGRKALCSLVLYLVDMRSLGTIFRLLISTLHTRVLIMLLQREESQWKTEEPNMAKKTGSMEPLADRVVVQALDEAEQTRGGLYIPDTAKEKPQEGKVISVGPGKLSEQGERLAPDVKKGDTVLYGKYSGTEVTVEGEDYLILRESDILAVIG